MLCLRFEHLDAGWYRTADGLFEVSKSPDKGGGWTIGSRTDEAYAILGEPARAPRFPTFHEAKEHLTALYNWKNEESHA